MKTIIAGFVGVGVLLLQNISYGDVLKPLNLEFKLPDKIIAPDDVSAIGKINSMLVIGSDEADADNKNFLQLLKKEADNSYSLHSNIFLFEGNKKNGKEMDIEGLTVAGQTIYAIGSHSSKRNKVKKKDEYKRNRKTFNNSKIEDERNRDWLYQITLDSDSKEIQKEKITLRNIIKEDKALKTFSNIPSKENGVDIEAIAEKGGWLYLGFRGPVFRENYVPVMKLKFDDAENSKQLLYVNLGGRGIRGMASVSDGFLILAGSVGDQSISYQLYHWDGKDVISGKDRNIADIGKVRSLGEIKPPQKGKAEGLVVMEENDYLYQLLVVYDGVEDKNNIMQRFHVSKF